MLDFEFWSKVGVDIVNKYRKHIFDQGKDIDGRKFKPYSTKGSKWVTINVQKKFKKSAPKEGYSYSQAKKKKMFPRQSNEHAGKTSPVLTGDLMRDFKLIKGSTSDKGFTFGTVSWGSKVEWLKGMKRNLYTGTKVLPTPIKKYFEKETKKYIDKKLKKKFKSKTYNI